MQRMIGAFLIGFALTVGGAQTVVAAAEDYVFEAVTTKVPESNDAIISVRLLNKVSGKPMANAIIFQTQARHVTRRHGRYGHEGDASSFQRTRRLPVSSKPWDGGPLGAQAGGENTGGTGDRAW